MGVSVTVFAGTLDLLEQVYGPKASEPACLNKLFALLGEVESIYQGLPADPRALHAGQEVDSGNGGGK